MTELTFLDAAHRDMEAAPNDEAKRMAFYGRLADCELFLALEGEPEGDNITPLVFPVEDAQLVLVFDRQDRLTDFLGGAHAYAALSGRALVPLLVGQGLGMMLNPEVAPSSMMLSHDALSWLNDTLSHAPDQMEATPSEISPPGALPEQVVTALDAKLASAAGLAKFAYLVTARYDTGGLASLLAFVDSQPGAEAALAQAANEALVFAGLDAASMDVAFFAASDPLAASLARHGLRFDLPQPEQPQTPGAPGMNPDQPPKLR